MSQSGLRRDVPNCVPATGTPASATALFCFSHLRWRFVYQRPQHLLTRAARSYPVVFFEEPVHDAIRSPRLDLSNVGGGVTVAVPVLPHGMDEADAERAQSRMLDQLVADRGGDRQIFWYYTPMALGFSGHHRPDLCIYDCMDELSGFRFAPAELLDRESALFAKADLVFTGGQSLYEAKRHRHPSVYAFASSIDSPHFGVARHLIGPEPLDQAGLARPRLGYFGVIDERLDLDLLARMAELRPDWQFVMIGPVVKVEQAALPRRANIHWLGARTYDELPAYLAGWNVGLMPFALNEATRFISPTKTPEFLAAGVPVVSTPVVDVVRAYGDAGLVEIAADAASMVARAEALLARPKTPWLLRVDALLATVSWDRTWDAMQTLMRRKLDAPARSAGVAAKEAAHV